MPSNLRSKIQAGSENLSLVSVASSGSSQSGCLIRAGSRCPSSSALAVLVVSLTGRLAIPRTTGLARLRVACPAAAVSVLPEAVRVCLLGVPQLAWTLRRHAVGSGRHKAHTPCEETLAAAASPFIHRAPLAGEVFAAIINVVADVISPPV